MSEKIDNIITALNGTDFDRLKLIDQSITIMVEQLAVAEWGWRRSRGEDRKGWRGCVEKDRARLAALRQAKARILDGQ
jgi:hypothetical protein